MLFNRKKIVLISDKDLFYYLHSHSQSSFSMHWTFNEGISISLNWPASLIGSDAWPWPCLKAFEMWPNFRENHHVTCLKISCGVSQLRRKVCRSGAQEAVAWHRPQIQWVNYKLHIFQFMNIYLRNPLFRVAAYGCVHSLSQNRKRHFNVFFWTYLNSVCADDKKWYRLESD